MTTLRNVAPDGTLSVWLNDPPEEMNTEPRWMLHRFFASHGTRPTRPAPQRGSWKLRARAVPASSTDRSPISSMKFRMRLSNKSASDTWVAYQSSRSPIRPATNGLAKLLPLPDVGTTGFAVSGVMTAPWSHGAAMSMMDALPATPLYEPPPIEEPSAKSQSAV